MTEEFDNLIVLTDEEGVETTWEHIGTFNVDENCYVAMLSLDGDCDCECDDAEYDAAAEEYTRIFDEGGFDPENEEEE